MDEDDDQDDGDDIVDCNLEDYNYKANHSRTTCIQGSQYNVVQCQYIEFVAKILSLFSLNGGICGFG